VNLAVAATVAALVFPAELPDKTFIASLVLSTRFRPLLVWLGVAGAFVVHAAIAVGAGSLLRLLPHEAVQIVVAVLFAGGAAYLLFVPESAEEDKGEQVAEAAPGQAQPVTPGRAQPVTPGRAEPGEPGGASVRRALLTSFGVVFVAEWGDLTQILTANLAARYHDPLAVFTGATVGLWAVAAIAVVAGRALPRLIPLTLIRRLAGIALLGFAVASAVSAA